MPDFYKAGSDSVSSSSSFNQTPKTQAERLDFDRGRNDEIARQANQERNTQELERAIKEGKLAEYEARQSIIKILIGVISLFFINQMLDLVRPNFLSSIIREIPYHSWAIWLGLAYITYRVITFFSKYRTSANNFYIKAAIYVVGLVVVIRYLFSIDLL